MPTPGKAVGSRVVHVDAQEKLSGGSIFGDDQAPVNALVVAAIRSPFHHAKFKFGDIDKFVDENEGVRGVLTANDIPGRNILELFQNLPINQYLRKSRRVSLVKQSLWLFTTQIGLIF